MNTLLQPMISWIIQQTKEKLSTDSKELSTRLHRLSIDQNYSSQLFAVNSHCITNCWPLLYMSTILSPNVDGFSNLWTKFLTDSLNLSTIFLEALVYLYKYMVGGPFMGLEKFNAIIKCSSTLLCSSVVKNFLKGLVLYLCLLIQALYLFSWEIL